jgi:hypothetical protein
VAHFLDSSSNVPLISAFCRRSRPLQTTTGLPAAPATVDLVLLTKVQKYFSVLFGQRYAGKSLSLSFSLSFFSHAKKKRSIRMQMSQRGAFRILSRIHNKYFYSDEKCSHDHKSTHFLSKRFLVFLHLFNT